MKYESCAYHTVLHKHPVVKFFFRLKFKKIIKLANLKKTDFILDFGCGDCWLKKILPEYKIIGYDLNPKQTEIEDYTKLRPDKIFVIDVFEHIPKEEIEKILKNFKKMNPDFELITSIPTENWISRKIRRLVGKREKAPDHITPIEQIWPILTSELRLIKKINFLTIGWLAKLKNQELSNWHE